MSDGLITLVFIADEGWSGDAPADLEQRVAAITAKAITPGEWEPLMDELDVWPRDTATLVETVASDTREFFDSLDCGDVNSWSLGAGFTIWIAGGSMRGDEPPDSVRIWSRFFAACQWLPLRELLGIRVELPDTVRPDRRRPGGVVPAGALSEREDH